MKQFCKMSMVQFVAAVVLLMLSCDKSTEPNAPNDRVEPPPYDIAYISTGQHQDFLGFPIYLIKSDGSGTKKLTPNNFWTWRWLCWSPDGKRIAFQAHNLEDVRPNLWTIDVRDGSLRQLTADSDDDMDPVWSPDGSEIAFYKIGNNGIRIFVVSADGTAIRQLTADYTNSFLPRWSPDGSKIAYSADTTSRFPPTRVQICVMNSDGSNPQRLTNLDAENVFPIWSHDGKRILFESVRDSTSQIFSMNSDGTNQTALTSGAFYDRQLDWAPDESQIAFTSNREGDGGIYLMNSDGENISRLTNQSGSLFPKWSPDGKKITFAGKADGFYHVFMMNRDGSDLQKLTLSENDDTTPVWRPINSN